MLIILQDAPLPIQFENTVALYAPKVNLVRAAKMPCRFELAEKDGRLVVGREGDYVVLDENDNPTKLSAAEFEALYDPWGQQILN
jgi:hypothetical protein